MIQLKVRAVPPRALHALLDQGVDPLLARLFAARGIASRSELAYGLDALLAPDLLSGSGAAADLLASAIARRARMLIVADYDCDGATACAVGVRALRRFGADVEYLVPNRFEYGYGLTPEIVDLAAQRKPELIITVDNGIASLEGVARARELGIATLITDHHLPGAELPAADVIVNPNQPGCRFPSKHMAGVGVMFYVALATRAEMRRRGQFAAGAEPNLAALLDLVALGTVADVVRLDHNNRILVTQGIARMRAGKMQAGVAALFAAAAREPARATATDLGFGLGPRLNAAGRLADMSLGIECLLSDDPARALAIAQKLDTLNSERREIETGMREAAEAVLDCADVAGRASVCLYQPDWHQGVVGILAGRIKDRTHRPALAFAPLADGTLRGSGRSIPGLHLRDALDLVAKRSPGLLLRFGGHAMAAGMSITAARFEEFAAAFDSVCTELIAPSELARTLETDGALESAYMSLSGAQLVDREVWGQGFPAPLFRDQFRVESQRLVRERHLKLGLRHAGGRLDAIWFNRTEPLPERIDAAYRLSVNEFRGLASLQLTLEHAAAAQA
ncbi:MAG: single-stranded-DNA-specific exonuclease RecJ [Rhodocyclaceae bacterium]|nr:single-stranded-DNA-specific exonuclease RecJ [Rhodocyclaceae bacterium]